MLCCVGGMRALREVCRAYGIDMAVMSGCLEDLAVSLIECIEAVSGRGVSACNVGIERLMSRRL